jgi:hypothetical protein
MNMRTWGYCAAAAFIAALSSAAAGPPPAGAWNIALAGQAGSSGGLHFRITPNDGGAPIDIFVNVIMGAREPTIASSVRNSLRSQLRPDRFKVELGEANSILVTDLQGQPDYSLELLESGIDNVRVAVRSVTVAPTPEQPADHPLLASTDPNAAEPEPDEETDSPPED